MQIRTRSGTPTYHPNRLGWTKYFFRPFTLVPYSKHECGTQDINNYGLPDIKSSLWPSRYCDPAKTGQEIIMLKTSLDASEFLHQYIEEFSCLYPHVEGFLEIKPTPPPNFWTFLRLPHLVPKPFDNPKLNQKIIPSYHVYPEMARKGWNHCHTQKNPCQWQENNQIEKCMYRAFTNQLANHTCKFATYYVQSPPVEVAWSNLPCFSFAFLVLPLLSLLSLFFLLVLFSIFFSLDPT